jgi:hypothetical protein
MKSLRLLYALDDSLRAPTQRGDGTADNEVFFVKEAMCRGVPAFIDIKTPIAFPGEY